MSVQTFLDKNNKGIHYVTHNVIALRSRAVLYDDGHLLALLSKHIWGVDYHDIHGTLKGHTAQFGHQTNM